MEYSAAQAPRQVNQIYRDLLSVNGLNPWVWADSSPRLQMFSSHIGQTLVIAGATERYCQTGMEREYGKYTFNVKMPSNGEIIKAIKRYPEQYGFDSIKSNPETVVVYEDEETKQVGIFTLKDHCSMHQYFGFPYKNTKAISQIHDGASIKGGTIFQDSPSITDNGGYKYGRELNMAFMSRPGVSEDGIEICRDVLPHFAYKTYETRVISFGNKQYPINLYGTLDNFKAFPDIGDMLREDGMLMCLRSYDRDLAVVEQGIHDLLEVDYTNDKTIYAAGPGGRVVDIRVHHDPESNKIGTPIGMEKQAEKYDIARRVFYNNIVSVYKQLQHRRGDSLVITPEFHRLIVEALSVVGETDTRVEKLHRKVPLDDWRIEFVVEYTRIPGIGNKLTDTHGGKGVICKICEPWEMPVDEHGNRADIVMDGTSTVNRMNIGRKYEQYINAASRDVMKKLRHDLDIKPTDPRIQDKLKQMEQNEPERFDRAWRYLLGYYQIVSPRQYLWFSDGVYERPRYEHLAYVVEKWPYLYIPTENEPEGMDIIRQLEDAYRPVYGPVSWINEKGVKVTTKKPVRIGSMYIIELEKVGDDWSAVSSGKFQNFGVLAQVTNEDKYSKPSRVHAIRALGESEVRIWTSYAGPALTAHVLDLNNNPRTHKHVLNRILEADQPTNIAVAVDRNEIPMGGSKPLQLFNHLTQTGGWEMAFEKHNPGWEYKPKRQYIQNGWT